ncbi:hypothetical protein ACTFIY_004002 [Dictyostelium cf. discoideum]
MALKTSKLFAFILSFFYLFFININCSSLKNYYIFKSYNQTGNRIDIELVNPLQQTNITSIENFYYQNVTSIINSCKFNSNSMSIDLTQLKNNVYNANYKNNIYFSFSICGPNSYIGYQSYYTPSYFYSTYSNTETFEIGRYGLDDFALMLNYSLPIGIISSIKFYCDWNTDFGYDINFEDIQEYYLKSNIRVFTKKVCQSINVERKTVDFNSTQPNTISIYLNANSSNVFSFNNDIVVEKLNLEEEEEEEEEEEDDDDKILIYEPIVYRFKSDEKDEDKIIIYGLFLESLQSDYIFMIGDKIILNSTNIISFNSSTIILNTKGYIENVVSINLHGNRREFKFSKKQNSLSLIKSDKLIYTFNCVNCVGSNFVGFSSRDGNQITSTSFSLNASNWEYNGERYIYFESPVSPNVQSNKLLVPTNLTNVYITLQSFDFYGGGIQISGYFIKNLIGELKFSNGTVISNLPYSATNGVVFANGAFTIPAGFGEGNFSIYNENKLIYTYSFSYLSPKQWVQSMQQDNQKIELILNYPFGKFFNITNIKYSTGRNTDYKLIQPNIVKFNLYPYSINTLAFFYSYNSLNEYLYVETLNNFSPVVYNNSNPNSSI